MADGAEGGEAKQSSALEPWEDKATRTEMLFPHLITSRLMQNVIKTEGRTVHPGFFIFPNNRGFLVL